MTPVIRTLMVNGEPRTLALTPGETLPDVLRERLRLTGTKRGCDLGDCGACTVLVDGRPMNSCLLLATTIADRRITTVEGLAHGGVLAPLQEAFVREGAIQSTVSLAGQHASPTVSSVGRERCVPIATQQ